MLLRRLDQILSKVYVSEKANFLLSTYVHGVRGGLFAADKMAWHLSANTAFCSFYISVSCITLVSLIDNIEGVVGSIFVLDLQWKIKNEIKYSTAHARRISLEWYWILWRKMFCHAIILNMDSG